MSLGLNRQEGRPDWELKDPKDWSWQQRLAARTKGWINFANVLTGAGLGSTGAGIIEFAQGRKALGIAMVLFGRGLDLADGAYANKFGLKSPLGEKLDATSDKIAMGIGLVALTVSGTIPIAPAVIMGAQNVINAGFSIYGDRKGNEVHASRSGKNNTFVQWGSIGGFMIAETMAPGSAQHFVEQAAWVTSIAGTVVIGGDATIQIIDEATKPQQTQKAA